MNECVLISLRAYFKSITLVFISYESVCLVTIFYGFPGFLANNWSSLNNEDRDIGD